MLSALLNRVITIEKGITTVNSVGTPAFIWSAYIDTYSGIYNPSGDTRFTQDGQIIAYSTVFTIRYNNDTKLINNKYRIKYNGNIYKIVQVEQVGRKDTIKLTAITFNDDGSIEI
jgi:SPP1 family predicted phage head-tail adaptor